MIPGDETARKKSARRVMSSAGYKVGGWLTPKGDEADDKSMIKSAISQHDAQLHSGAHTRLKLADGGMASGGMSASRGDRSPRGKKGAKNHINIIVAPGGPPAGGPPPMPPPGMMSPPPKPPMPPPGPPPGAGPPGAGGPPMPPPGMMPPGAPPGMMPPPGAGLPPPGMPRPGMPPMMRKAGGRAGQTERGGVMGPSVPHRAISSASRPALGTPPVSGDPTKIETAAAQVSDFRPGEKEGGRTKQAAGGRAYSPPHMTAGAGSGVGRLEKAGLD